ncbi:MAG: isoprenylcysteine carboxylmethyltransferase family protein [Deltaproteobacteria bacterium]|nr:isoprenylcysteine carboxylmethyltransferase family protein [Deltaproteobacteria bacterium]
MDFEKDFEDITTMRTGSIVDKIFLSNPFRRGMFELLILIGSGICGLVFSWTRFSVFPISNILGGILVIFALVFHGWTEKNHKQAHEQSDHIDKIVVTGVHAKIRHPLYLSLIVQNIGIALAFGVLITFLLSVLTIGHWVVTSLKEEAVLLQTFPNEYRHYQKTVRWRMIPGLF